VADKTNTALRFMLYEDGSAFARGTITAPSFVSTSGFKSHIPLGTHWRQTTQGGVQRTIEPVVNTTNNGLAWIVSNRVMPFAGSVVGIIIMLDRTISADVTVQVYKNDMSGTGAAFIDLMGVRSFHNTPIAPITFAKGSYPFNAGDYLGMGCYISTGYVFVATCGVIVEFGA
jgi:hypothetical protein